MLYTKTILFPVCSDYYTTTTNNSYVLICAPMSYVQCACMRKFIFEFYIFERKCNANCYENPLSYIKITKKIYNFKPALKI